MCCRMRVAMNSIVFSCPIVSKETLTVCREQTPMMTLTMGWWSTVVQPSLKTVVTSSCAIALIFPMFWSSMSLSRVGISLVVK
jgi:hypothetical protein